MLPTWGGIIGSLEGQVNQSASKPPVSLIFAHILAISIAYAPSIHSNQFQSVIEVIQFMRGDLARHRRSIHGLLRRRILARRRA